jgi:hypothetical protein
LPAAIVADVMVAVGFAIALKEKAASSKTGSKE